MENQKSFKERKLKERYDVIREQMKQDFQKKSLSMRNRQDVFKYLDDILWTFSTYGALVGFGIGVMGSSSLLWFTSDSALWLLGVIIGLVLLFVGAKEIGNEHIKVEECSKLLR